MPSYHVQGSKGLGQNPHTSELGPVFKHMATVLKFYLFKYFTFSLSKMTIWNFPLSSETSTTSFSSHPLGAGNLQIRGLATVVSLSAIPSKRKSARVWPVCASISKLPPTCGLDPFLSTSVYYQMGVILFPQDTWTCLGHF